MLKRALGAIAFLLVVSQSYAQQQRADAPQTKDLRAELTS